MGKKDEQIQIRVSAEQKAAIKRAAAQDKKELSRWVLERVFSEKGEEFQLILKGLSKSTEPRFILAELNDFLWKLRKDEFKETILTFPITKLSNEMANRVAAMIEVAASKKSVSPPQWVFDIKPCIKPIFDSNLLSLRLYLLMNSPLPFRRRAIFTDATVGDRV